MTSPLVGQIDALLHMHKNARLTPPVPGLAIELLEKARDALRATPAGVTVTDEIERSRNTWSDWYAQANDQRNKAEARADALQAKLDEAKAVLEPFANFLGEDVFWDRNAPDNSAWLVHDGLSLIVGPFRRARTFLATLTEHIDGDVLNSAGKSNTSEVGAINGGLRGERQASTSGGGNG